MPENPVLLQAVLDHPEDEAPRLAYAAWCDARADPRGEIIRLGEETRAALCRRFGNAR